MCGIFGIVTPGRPISVPCCYRGTQSLTHRGPDGLGVLLASVGHDERVFFLNPALASLREAEGRNRPFDVFLGHRRLSIIDLTDAAAQPMSDHEGGVWVVYNGEIYNHVELRRRLEGLGHTFRTDHSDTEVLIQGYLAWGPDLVDHLRGMFAFVILDLNNELLFLARDRFGEKPLYYRPYANGLAFASELKALHVGGLLERTISRNALGQYLSLGYIPAPGSIYREAFKLEAASRLIWPLRRSEVPAPRRYWSLSFDPRPVRDAGAWSEEFDELLGGAIDLRLVSDVPVGSFLSGGLDSTVVTRRAAGTSSDRLSSFNIAFHDPEFDEGPFAEQVAVRYGTDHTMRRIDFDELVPRVSELARIFDEPFADSSALPTLCLAELARTRVKVALSGDGGDELLAGYSRYTLNHHLGRVFDHLPGRGLAALLAPLRWIWPQRIRGRGLVNLFHEGGMRRYGNLLIDGWLPARSEIELPVDGRFPEPHGSAGTLVDRMCLVDIESYLPENLMVKVDRTAMSVSLEARAPLLDHKLFEFVARSPRELTFKPGAGKIPFRRLLDEDFNSSFVNRPKRGFAMPLGRWFRGELRGAAMELLRSDNGLVGRLFSRKTIERLLLSHQQGSRDQSVRIWKLIILDAWHRRYGGRLEDATPARG